MDPRLREAAETGNIDAFHALIEEDPDILERTDQIAFIQTPLHVAANRGDISFAMEMMNLKPSFAKKLNPHGFSPMHLAVITGQNRLVLRLLKANKDLVCVKGWGGLTPFHYVVATGNSRLLVDFLEASPGCIEDVTVRDETAFHLVLKQNQIEAFNILIGWLQMANWEDDEGNTLLHIAAKKKQYELFLDSQLWLHVKAKDSEGLMALQILNDANRRGVNRNRNESEEFDTKIKHLKDKVIFKRIRVLGDRTRHSMSVDMINTMLVVTALVITAIYTSSLTSTRWCLARQWIRRQHLECIPCPIKTLLIHLIYGYNNHESEDLWGVLVLEPCNMLVHGSCNIVPCHPAVYVGHLLLLLHDNLSANHPSGIRQPFLHGSVCILGMCDLLLQCSLVNF